MCHPDGHQITHSDQHISATEEMVAVSGTREMPVSTYRPDDEPGAPVVLLHDIYGRTPFYRSLGARLAGAGYTALLPDFFFRQPPLPDPTREAAHARRRELDENRALEDLETVIEWSLGLGAGQRRVGTLGFCLGGTFALALGGRRSDVVTVSYYGFPAGLPGPFAAASPLEMAEHMTGPILAFWGEEEELVDLQDVKAFSERMTELAIEYEYQLYPGVGHGFLAHGDDPTSPASAAAADSWRRTLEFLDRHLADPARP